MTHGLCRLGVLRPRRPSPTGTPSAAGYSLVVQILNLAPSTPAFLRLSENIQRIKALRTITYRPPMKMPQRISRASLLFPIACRQLKKQRRAYTFSAFPSTMMRKTSQQTSRRPVTSGLVYPPAPLHSGDGENAVEETDDILPDEVVRNEGNERGDRKNPRDERNRGEI